MKNIERFSIRNLHGHMNFELIFADNTLVLVGENGTGKTTVLRMLYYLLSGQWSLLKNYKFDSLTLSIDGKKYKITHSLLDRVPIKSFDERLAMKFSPRFRYELMNAMRRGEGDLTENLCKISNRFDIPVELILREFERDGYLPRSNSEKKLTALKELKENFRNAFDAQILYLPTYRRIEQDIEFVFKDIAREDILSKHELMQRNKNKKTSTELIEFGMRDVDHAINVTLEELKEFARDRLNTLTLGYLGDVVGQKYTEIDVNQIKDASNETIENVLNRIHERILSAESKHHLSQIIAQVKKGQALDEHAQVICHYFIKLLAFQQELQEKESQITKFCSVCNQYMTTKQFCYDSSSFTFSLFDVGGLDNSPRAIELRNLSSGEKQIVSIFSHLYLSGSNMYFVLIDEPELSLSVTWQKTFLEDIMRSNLCIGLVAVTHSPFIYNNGLKKYARSLGEFAVSEGYQQ